MENLSNEYCIIPPDLLIAVRDSQGKFFAEISKIDPMVIAKDLLDPEKPINQANILEHYIELHNKRVLEVGSGLGVQHIVWTNKYKIDGYGVEPEGIGFHSSYSLSKRLIEENKLDPNRIKNAVGEQLPFPANDFDIVYSTNVLEHVQDPAKVLQEGLRVLRPGGTLQFVFPNYHSYFDGHYAIFHPPLPSNNFFQFYVKYIIRRDPSYAKTINTELNPGWVRRQLEYLAENYNIKVITLGEDIFFCKNVFFRFCSLRRFKKGKKNIGIIQ